MMKKLLSFMLAVILIFGCTSVVASAETINDTEPNNDLDTAQVIQPNCTVLGTVIATDLEAEEPDLDLDVYKFVLTERSKIVLTLTSDSELLIPFIADESEEEIYMPEIDLEAETLPDELVITEFLKKGTYYVVISDILSEKDVNYTFTMTCESAVQSLKKENGVWKYYVGANPSNETTLIKFKGVWFYVENGVWNKSANTLVKYEDNWFYVKGGKWTSKPTTLVKYKNKWFYIKNGKWNSEAKTLVKYKNKWFYIKNGKWAKETAIVKYSGKKFYVKGGFAKLDFSGKKKINGQTYIIKNGKVV